jgi:hypothetical protein
MPTQELLLIVATSIIALLGVFFSPLSVDAFVDLELGTLLKPSLGLLLLLIAPAAYTATISTEKFRKESLVALVVFPVVFLGDVMAIAGVVVPLSAIFASYVSRSKFNGKNYFWTFYKAGSSVALVLALVSASLGAFMVAQDGDFRGRLRTAVTGEATEKAETVVDESVGAGASQVSTIVQNSSSAAISITQQRVLTAAQQSGDFSSEQMQFLQQEFQNASQEVPTQVSDQFAGGIEQAQESGAVSSPVKKGVSGALDLVFERKGMLAVAVFMTLLSFGLFLKIPFGLFGALVGWTFYKSLD